MGLKTSILACMFLVACGGGDGGSPLEPYVSANVVTIRAYNTQIDYIDQYSELQELIDQGGKIELGCGVYDSTVLVIKQAVIISGSGPCTRIASIRGDDTTRFFGVLIENLTIDGNIDGYNHIGIDYRNISSSIINNVRIVNVDYGVLAYKESYGNTFGKVFINAERECFEIVEGANENTITGGSCINPDHYGIGIFIQKANNTKIFGTWLENLNVGISVNALSTSVYSPRLENINIGIELMEGSSKTTIYSAYRSNLSEYIRGTNYKEYGY